jgi:2-iminobutanoate/2-iminopropanoate deaminase
MNDDSRQVISTDSAPGAVGPYSQAIRSGDLVFTAGQIALDPASGKLVSDEVAAQTRQVLKNLVAVLDAAGCEARNVVKTTIFLVDMGDFAAVNEVYAEVFGASLPARSTVAVAALPLGARVEIEAVARSPR